MAKPIFKAEKSFHVSAGELSTYGILPMSPWVEIQFRTNITATEEVNLSKAKPSDTNEWTTVTFRKPNSNYVPPTKSGDTSSLKFDNFFENLTLEDNGGVVKCSMQLFDKDLERLENIVIKSVIATKGGNDLATKRLDKVPAKSILEFMPNPSNNINFRVRFGYSDPVESDRIKRPALMSSPEWKDRTKKGHHGNIYLKSPWIYFMMMGLNFNLTKKGLVANVEGISISNSFLDKTKIIKRFALMKGTPQFLFKRIAEQMYLATGGRVQVVDTSLAGSTGNIVGEPVIPEGSANVGINVDYGEPSDLPIQWAVEPKEGEDTFPENLSDKDRKDLEESSKWLNISLSLGGEPRYEIDENGVRTSNIINEFMSLKELLNDFISKVPAILRNKENNTYITDAEKVKEIIDNKNNKYDPTVFEPIPYTYSINEQTWDVEKGAKTDTVVVIRFFYRRLDNTKQGFVRSYDYMNSPRSIITNFNVKNKLDFIQLNQSIIVKGNEVDVLLSAPAESAAENEGSAPANVSETFYDQLNSNNFTLVNKVVENTGDSNANIIANKVIQNMNQGIFYGNVEILGDPFYLFDATLQPFQYYIRLNVYRNYNEYNTSISNQKILNPSYLTGYYLIKKITHTLGSNGFKTTLDVQRYPTTGIEDLS
ncbi:MAG: hypothetical protein DRJ01_00330 [Bacteroidetes bacterium]|nr:MAG: hypothetical protein DRJ01_00330 [Bacteroidota bacterium]